MNRFVHERPITNSQGATTNARSPNQVQPHKLRLFLRLIQDLKQEIHTTFTSQLMEIKGQFATLSRTTERDTTGTRERIHATNANESPTKQPTSNILENFIC